MHIHVKGRQAYLQEDYCTLRAGLENIVDLTTVFLPVIDIIPKANAIYYSFGLHNTFRLFSNN